VRRFDTIESCLGAVWLKETIDDATALGIGKIDRQAFRTERFANVFDELGQVNVFTSSTPDCAFNTTAAVSTAGITDNARP
jgi:hypothetical protein